MTALRRRSTLLVVGKRNELINSSSNQTNIYSCATEILLSCFHLFLATISFQLAELIKTNTLLWYDYLFIIIANPGHTVCKLHGDPCNPIDTGDIGSYGGTSYISN